MALRQELTLDEHSLITSQMIDAHRLAIDDARNIGDLAIQKAQLAKILDAGHQSFMQLRPAAHIIERMTEQLHGLRQQATPAAWRELIAASQRHRIMDYLMQDPFTRWSFTKPRGYSGDASLLDFLYKHPSITDIVASSTLLGQEIYAFTSDVASSEAGRERRDILARTVDETAHRAGETAGEAEVLAIACGYLREAEISEALRSGNVKRWIGLDQDPASVAIVNRDLAGTAVKAVEGSVHGLLRRSYTLGTFDLVYASGLYDYLVKPVGVRLLERAMELVKPGGAFLFANFSNEITTGGYMETFMNWPLILRSADDMSDIIRSAAGANRWDAQVFYGENRNLVYGRVHKPKQ